ncbi:hypothetical protein N9F36_08365, partial [Akkermansiaceae bacterium]|nr:hypothetical protein [Akkermansiaceae bacterium]
AEILSKEPIEQGRLSCIYLTANNKEEGTAQALEIFALVSQSRDISPALLSEFARSYDNIGKPLSRCEVALAKHQG